MPTFADAARRVLATTVQAAAGCGIILMGLLVAGDASRQTVLSALAGSFVVPVLTAVHRYAQAWIAALTEE
jgi:hypothetical protein